MRARVLFGTLYLVVVVVVAARIAARCLPSRCVSALVCVCEVLRAWIFVISVRFYFLSIDFWTCGFSNIVVVLIFIPGPSSTVHALVLRFIFFDLYTFYIYIYTYFGFTLRRTVILFRVRGLFVCESLFESSSILGFTRLVGLFCRL